MTQTRKQPDGFTLVELLVVIGIIAVLIGILLPALGRAKAQAQRSQCLSNLRQLATAAQNYMANNKGAFPFHSGYNDPATSWDDVVVASPLNGVTNNSALHPNWLAGIWPYLGKEARAMQCPSSPEYPEISGGMTNNFEQAVRTYVCNGVVTHYSGRRIKRPSEVCTFKDDGSPNATTGATVRPRWAKTTPPNDTDPGWVGWMYFGDPFAADAPPGTLTDKYHQGGQCLAFLDGHAEWRRAKDITCKTFGLEPNPGARGVVELFEARVSGYTNAARWFRRAVK